MSLQAVASAAQTATQRVQALSAAAERLARVGAELRARPRGRPPVASADHALADQFLAGNMISTLAAIKKLLGV